MNSLLRLTRFQRTVMKSRFTRWWPGTALRSTTKEEPLRYLVTAIALVCGLAATGAAGATGSGPVVFVQTNETSGNHIVTYDVAGDGTLTQAGAFANGGNGGVAAP